MYVQNVGRTENWIELIKQQQSNWGNRKTENPKKKNEEESKSKGHEHGHTEKEEQHRMVNP